MESDGLAIPGDRGPRLVIANLLRQLAHARFEIAVVRKSDQQPESIALRLAVQGLGFERRTQFRARFPRKEVAVIGEDARCLVMLFAPGVKQVLLAHQFGIEVAEALAVFGQLGSFFLLENRSAPGCDQAKLGMVTL